MACIYIKYDGMTMVNRLGNRKRKMKKNLQKGREQERGHRSLVFVDPNLEDNMNMNKLKMT